MSWAQRQLVGELMDDPGLAATEHAAALDGLRRINAASRTAANLWPATRRILADGGDRPATLLDVACGGGDVVLDLARRAQRGGYALDAQGCDISDTAVRHAANSAQHRHLPARFFKIDVLSEPLPRHYTIITCSLFLHHLDDAQIQALLGKLAMHADHLIVSDLIRGRMGYVLAWCGTRLLSTSHIVHEDGLRSVRAALTLPEARALAAAAGLHGAHFRRCWPQRFLMTWSDRETSP